MRIPSNNFARAAIVLSLNFLLSCANLVEMEKIPPSHPAHPDAPAARIPSLGLDLKSDTSEASAEEDRNRSDKSKLFTTESDEKLLADGQAAEGGKYQCPMHPHIYSEKPANCPKCGMKMKKVKVGQDD